MNKRTAILKVKQAYRLFLTHGIKPCDIPMEYAGSLVVFWVIGWTIVLNENGTLASATKW